MKKVKFTTKYATKKKGDVVEIDTMIASILVNKLKVAQYVEK